MTEPLTPADQAGATASAIVANADALGLTWRLRQATAVSNTNIVLDGDTEPITATAVLIGGMAALQRVWVITVPPSGNYVIGGSELGSGNVNSLSGIFSTTSPNFQTMNVAALTFTKRATATRLVLDMRAGGYLTGAAGAMVDIGLLINGGDYLIGSLVYNMINLHLPITGILYVAGGAVPAGTYSILGRVRVSGGSTINMDSGDRVSFEVVEKV